MTFLSNPKGDIYSNREKMNEGQGPGGTDEVLRTVVGEGFWG